MVDRALAAHTGHHNQDHPEVSPVLGEHRQLCPHTPTAGMPDPVRWFAENQPVTSIVNTIRDLFATVSMRTYRRKIA